MGRLGLIEEGAVLPVEKGFLLCDEEGVGKVTLLSIIGRGGTAIAYKGIRYRNGNAVTCIVKEYFPEQKETSGIYIRNNIGEKITIAERYKEAEMQLQMENVRRELRTNQNLYFNEDNKREINWNNSSYIYSAEYLCKLGDSSYIVLDSSEGETLYSRLKRNKSSVEETFRLIYQMLIIVSHLDKKGYVHCDIKPENLWLRGEGENQSMCLLDFGSAFKLSDYRCDISRMNEEEIMDAADHIMKNESIGSNTRGYSSVNVGRLESNKNIYNLTDHSIKRARALLKSVNSIGTGDDLFSVVKVAEQLLNQTDMTNEERKSMECIWEEAKRKNSDEGFETVDELKKEFEIMEVILHKGAHPAVLEQGIKRMMKNWECEDFDQNLLCDIK